MSSEFKNLKFLSANRRNEVEGLKCGKSLTEQQWKESCDINFVVKQYAGIGMSGDQFIARMNAIYKDAGEYLDVSNITDSAQAYMKYDEALNSFIENVPASIRDKFNNDAMKFYKFVQTNPDGFANMMKDYKNYNAPSVDKVEDAKHSAPVSPVTDKKE